MDRSSRKLRMRGRVGSKGELFVPKAIRELLGLEPGVEVEYIVEGNKLVVRKVPRIVDAMKSENIELVVGIEEFEAMSSEVLGSMDSDIHSENRSEAS